VRTIRIPKREKSIVTRDTEGLEMSLHVVEKIMTRECMRQVHKLSERHFAGIMGERLRKSCRDRLSIRKSSTVLSFIYFTLFITELIPMTWVWSKSLLWVAAAAAYKYVTVSSYSQQVPFNFILSIHSPLLLVTALDLARFVPSWYFLYSYKKPLCSALDLAS
jgi:hypothetical protein